MASWSDLVLRRVKVYLTVGRLVEDVAALAKRVLRGDQTGLQSGTRRFLLRPRQHSVESNLVGLKVADVRKVGL